MSPTPVSSAAPIAAASKPERPIADLVYQGMTIAAMLWLLASLCVF